jgi:cytochrome c oxidase assembly protein subunit 15
VEGPIAVTTRPDPRLHHFARIVAGATFFLVVAGASVTSTGSGLAVPDWPLSYGTLFPPMEGGIFFEHGHRMIAGVVLLLTMAMTVWLFRREERAWVRRLGILALMALVLQAVLGGLTVLHRLPAPISVAHAGLAMGFFALTVGLSLFTSPGWGSVPAMSDTPSLRLLSLATTCVIYLQIVLGAIVRHMGAGLAIPDFPLAFGRLVPPVWSTPIIVNYVHRVGAVVVTACVLVLFVCVSRAPRRATILRNPAALLAGLVLAQLVLGAVTVLARRAAVPATAHVAVGAASLATSLVLTLRFYRMRSKPDARHAARPAPVKIAAAAEGAEP